MQVSSWRPSQPIGHLITELEKRGPLVVGGCFGALHYTVPARNLEKKLETERFTDGLKLIRKIKILSQVMPSFSLAQKKLRQESLFTTLIPWMRVIHRTLKNSESIACPTKDLRLQKLFAIIMVFYAIMHPILLAMLYIEKNFQK